MQNKKPPFTITEKILTDVMEICELVGKVSSTQHLSSDPVPVSYTHLDEYKRQVQEDLAWRVVRRQWSA